MGLRAGWVWVAWCVVSVRCAVVDPGSRCESVCGCAGARACARVCGRARADRVEGCEHLAGRAATRRRSQMGCDGRVDAGDRSARESRWGCLRHARECGVPVVERGLGTCRESGGCPVRESARDGCLRLGYERVARERDACSRVSGRAGLCRGGSGAWFGESRVGGGVRSRCGRVRFGACAGSYLVDPASSHMLVSKIKPCMSKYKRLYTVKLRMAH